MSYRIIIAILLFNIDACLLAKLFADELPLPSISHQSNAKIHELRKTAQKLMFSEPIEDEIQARQKLVTYFETAYGKSYYDTISEQQELDHALRMAKLTMEQRVKAYKARERFRAGLAFEEEHNVPKAFEFYAEALSINRELFGNRDPSTIACMDRVSPFQFQMGESEQAVENARSAVRLGREVYRDKHPLIAFYLGTLAGLETSRGNIQIGEKLIDEALEMDSEMDHLESIYHAKRLLLKAMILNRTRRYAEAASMARQSTSLATTAEPIHGELLVASQAELAKAYFGQQQFYSCTVVVAKMTKQFRVHRDAIPVKEQIELMTAYRDSLIALRRIEEADAVAKSIEEERQKLKPK